MLRNLEHNLEYIGYISKQMQSKSKAIRLSQTQQAKQKLYKLNQSIISQMKI